MYRVFELQSANLVRAPLSQRRPVGVRLVEAENGGRLWEFHLAGPGFDVQAYAIPVELATALQLAEEDAE